MTDSKTLILPSSSEEVTKLFSISVKLNDKEKYNIIVDMDEKIDKIQEKVAEHLKEKKESINLYYISDKLESTKTVFQSMLEPDCEIACIVNPRKNITIDVKETKNINFVTSDSDSDSPTDVPDINFKLITVPIFDNTTEQLIKTTKEHSLEHRNLDDTKKIFKDMGFQDDEIIKALELTKYNTTDALEYLTTGKVTTLTHTRPIRSGNFSPEDLDITARTMWETNSHTEYTTLDDFIQKQLMEDSRKSGNRGGVIGARGIDSGNKPTGQQHTQRAPPKPSLPSLHESGAQRHNPIDHHHIRQLAGETGLDQDMIKDIYLECNRNPGLTKIKLRELIGIGKTSPPRSENKPTVTEEKKNPPRVENKPIVTEEKKIPPQDDDDGIVTI